MTRLITSLAQWLQRLVTAQLKTEETPIACKPTLSNQGISYVDDKGQKLLEWKDLAEVRWSEPEYGYGMFGSPSHWLVREEGVIMPIEIEDESSFGLSDSEIVLWFGKKLPGFDVRVIEKAFESGYLGKKPPPGETLVCWTKAKVPNNAYMDSPRKQRNDR